jgi:FtsP/CotA-like multicopper oxidase with cupredoxin domain
MARVGDLLRAVTNTVKDPFSTDPSGLPATTATRVVDLNDGETFALTASPVSKRLGESTVRMLAYNGSIPGPTLRVAQGSTALIEFANETDVPTTVHWHGIRLDHRFDGVPAGHHRGMQAPVAPGERFAYRLSFPDPGLYWYHPHVREDYSQELGLYGNILVVPHDPSYWGPVDRELVLVLDDILLKGRRVAPFSRTESNRTAMGRYGNVMLINGEPEAALVARQGEVVRLFLTNTANVRPFNLQIPGARMKLAGGDGGRIERERVVDSVMIAPSERAIVDVQFSDAGTFALEHRGPDSAHQLGSVTVEPSDRQGFAAAAFDVLRQAPELAAERSRLGPDLARDPDHTLALVAVMPGMKQGGHGGGHGHVDIEWEDTMALHNRMTTPRTMFWKLVDQATGAENTDIAWTFHQGDRVKLRIENGVHSDHPMQHPFHIHGQRFLVLSRDGVAEETLVWKDTVLVPTGQTVDLLVEMANPGTWMAHCHIAEHLEGGMMLTFDVLTADEDALR